MVVIIIPPKVLHYRKSGIVNILKEFKCTCYENTQVRHLHYQAFVLFSVTFSKFSITWRKDIFCEIGASILEKS